MRKFLTACFSIVFLVSGFAQVKPDDFGRIILNTHVPENLTIPAEAKNFLVTKMNQIASVNGMGGSQANPRFIISVSINVGTKDIIAGPPQMIAQNLELTFFTGDAITNTIFSSSTVNLKGVGSNESKAFIEAFKTLNPKNKDIQTALEEGKNKIIGYYQSKCDFIIKEAQTFVKQEKYDEAIYQLSLVPDVCQDCYFRCLDTLGNIYQRKIDSECKIKLNQAKVTWAAAQNATGAENAGEIMSTINPMATCQPEVDVFIKSINSKLRADEKAKWDFKVKQYQDRLATQKEEMRIAVEKSQRDDVYRENQAKRNVELDKIRVKAYRDVAVEYARNQPKTVTYNNIYWR
jgi:hypothetical protein